MLGGSETVPREAVGEEGRQTQRGPRKTFSDVLGLLGLGWGPGCTI